MAKAIVCDRCGADSEKLKGYYNFVELKAMKYNGLNSVTNDCELNIDLCKKCLEEVVCFSIKRNENER